MRDFRAGATRVLVGTTVVEVGVDVPEATLMVIEDAEQHGLATLHQLRGRVGRWDRPGHCILLHGDPLEGAARRRLEKLAALDAGEDVAKADLELRGSGDLGGTPPARRRGAAALPRPRRPVAVARADRGRRAPTFAAPTGSSRRQSTASSARSSRSSGALSPSAKKRGKAAAWRSISAPRRSMTLRSVVELIRDLAIYER